MEVGCEGVDGGGGGGGCEVLQVDVGPGWGAEGQGCVGFWGVGRGVGAFLGGVW